MRAVWEGRRVALRHLLRSIAGPWNPRPPGAAGATGAGRSVDPPCRVDAEAARPPAAPAGHLVGHMCVGGVVPWGKGRRGLQGTMGIPASTATAVRQAGV